MTLMSLFGGDIWLIKVSDEIVAKIHERVLKAWAS